MPKPLTRLWPPTTKGLRKALGYTLATILLYVTLITLTTIWLPVPATPLMVWRLINGYGWHHQWVALENMPRAISRAAIASEDNRFCEHNGVDWEAVHKVYQEWQQGKGLRGASTISMQTAKNVYLWPNQDVVRKALEIPFTYLIETLWGKRRIMEVYLNIAEWGPGIYGIGAAARYHFKKPASKLTLSQISYLVAILPAPLRWEPRDMPISTLLRAESIPSRMQKVSTACLRTK